MLIDRPKKSAANQQFEKLYNCLAIIATSSGININAISGIDFILFVPLYLVVHRRRCLTQCRKNNVFVCGDDCLRIRNILLLSSLSPFYLGEQSSTRIAHIPSVSYFACFSVAVYVFNFSAIMSELSPIFIAQINAINN